jgi:hypothetical protein
LPVRTGNIFARLNVGRVKSLPSLLGEAGGVSSPLDVVDVPLILTHIPERRRRRRMY